MDIYPNILLAGWVTLFVLGSCLLLLACPRKVVFQAYNRARRLLGLAFLVLGLEMFLLWALDAREHFPHVATALNLSLGSLGAVLLNFSFCGLLDRRYLTLRLGTRELGGCLLFAALLWGLLWALPSFRPRVLLFAAVVFFVNVVRLSYAVIKAYRSSRQSLENYYSDERSHFTRWMRKSARGVIALGFSGAFFSFAPAGVNAAYVLVSLVFFVYVYLSMNNYLVNYPQVETAVRAQRPAKAAKAQEREDKADHALAQVALEGWIARKGYLTPGITIEKLAQACGTNRLYLSAYINTVRGVNFRDFVNVLRLDYAAGLMEAQPHMSVADVAQASGFSSAAYFSRLFVKHKGLLPMQYKAGQEKQEAKPQGPRKKRKPTSQE